MAPLLRNKEYHKMNAVGSRALQAAIQAGNVNIAGAMQTEEMELSSASKAEVALHGEALLRLEAQKRARSMVVPTAIDDVKLRLRELGHPITMFGEGHFDRRERLKMVLAQIELDAEASSKGGIIIGSSDLDLQEQQLQNSQQQLQRQKKEIVYTHASEELAQARSFLCDFSFPRARARLDARRRLFDEVQPPESASNSRESADSAAQTLYSHCQNLVLGASAAAQDRPFVCVRVSPSGALLATGSLGTSVRLWDAQNLVERDRGLRAHEERIMSLAWHPSAGLESDAPEILASCAADGLCVLWDCRAASEGSSDGMVVVEPAPAVGGSGGGRELRRLAGHVGPVADCCFHPSGRYVGTAGHDNTWRLWEVETGRELLLQDGHAKECSALAFQCDGALCLTGDAAGVALLWDLRSGQAVHACQGHVGKIR